MYILFLVIIGLALWLVIPMLIDQARRFVQSITTLLQNLEDIVGDGISIGPFFINQSLIFEQASTSLQSALQPMLGQTINIVGSVLSSLLWVVFILIISFYLVKDGRAIFDWFEETGPAGIPPSLPAAAWGTEYYLVRLLSRSAPACPELYPSS